MIRSHVPHARRRARRLLTSLERGAHAGDACARDGTDPELIAAADDGRGDRVAPATPTPTYATDARGAADGLTGFTHLFNAMSPLAAASPAWSARRWRPDALVRASSSTAATSTRWCCGSRCAASRLDRFMLVTDAMPSRRRRTGQLHAPGQDDPGARRRCSTTRRHARGLGPRHGQRGPQRRPPARPRPRRGLAHGERCPAEFLGLGARDRPHRAGLRADLVLLDDDLRVRETWIGGVSGAEAAGPGGADA